MRSSEIGQTGFDLSNALTLRRVLPPQLRVLPSKLTDALGRFRHAHQSSTPLAQIASTALLHSRW
jgi:hypothetical protein